MVCARAPESITSASASAPTVVGSERLICAKIARCVVFRPLGASAVQLQRLPSLAFAV
jgi:hypothetical protein